MIFFKKISVNRGLLCRASTKSYLFSTWQYIRSVIRFENSIHHIKRGHIWSNFDTRCVRLILLNRIKNAKPPLSKKAKFVSNNTSPEQENDSYLQHFNGLFIALMSCTDPLHLQESRDWKKVKVISKCCTFANNHKQ